MTRHRQTRSLTLQDQPSRPRRTWSALPVRVTRLASLALLAFLGSLTLPAAAAAQDLYSWTFGVLGGVGGSVDVKPGSRSFSNASWQVEGQALTDTRTLLVARVGHLGLGGKNTLFGDRLGADLTYLTLAGQYMYEESYYDSGIYLGIGGYKLGGTDVNSGRSSSQTVIGGVFGVTGEFRSTKRFGVLVELSGHYINVKSSHIFAMAHAGLAFHF